MIPALVAGLAVLQLLIFWPGVITPDSLAQYGQAVSGHYEDWHPPIMAFLWRQLWMLAPGQAPFLVVDALLYWGGILLLADSLRRIGRPRAALAVVAIAAMPIPLGQIGGIVKDSLLAACCLAAVGLAAQGSRTARAIAAALLVVAAATRFNGSVRSGTMVAGLADAASAGPPRAIRHGGLLLAALALLSMTSWLINQVALAPLKTHPMSSLVGFDLAGIIDHGGKATIPPLSRDASQAAVTRCYTPAQFNPRYRDDCDDIEEDLQTAADGRLAGYWLATVSRQPLPWLRHRLAHLNLNWRFLVARVPDDAIYIMPAPVNDLGLSYRASPAAAAIYRAASALAASPLGRPATWLAVALVLLILSPWFRLRRAVTALVLSALLYGGAYAIVSVAPDLRYNLWTMLSAALALAIAAGRSCRGSSSPADLERRDGRRGHVDRDRLDAVRAPRRLSAPRLAATGIQLGERPVAKRGLVHRHGDRVALHRIAADHPQDIDLIGILDAFGDHLIAEPVHQRDDGMRHRTRLGRFGDVGDQAAIELQPLDRHVAQPGEIGVAGAEIVDRHPDAERP